MKLTFGRIQYSTNEVLDIDWVVIIEPLVRHFTFSQFELVIIVVIQILLFLLLLNSVTLQLILKLTKKTHQ